VVARYAPGALRLMLLCTHYRAPINYTQRALEESSDRAYYIYQTLADADAALAAEGGAGEADGAAAAAPAKAGKKAPPPGPAEEAAAAAAALPAAVSAALSDDLNTPQARDCASHLTCAPHLMTCS
jgi:cysteinyl-tRNA synthetase